MKNSIIRLIVKNGPVETDCINMEIFKEAFKDQDRETQLELLEVFITTAEKVIWNVICNPDDIS